MTPTDRAREGKPMKKKQSVKKKSLKVKCSDCGAMYTAGAQHAMFCPAHTCSECGSSFSYSLPIYDSREKPPIRLCDNCLNERLDAEEKDL